MTNHTAVSSERCVTVAVTSGKGGVGKTSVVVNLAIALAGLRKRVLVLDGDLGLGSVDVLLGLTPSSHTGHVLAGERALADTLVPGPGGIQIIPASSGIRQLASLGRHQRRQLLDELHILATDFDFLLIDTAPGISDNVIETVQGADLTLVVTSADPAAIVDAYAMVKLLTIRDGDMALGLLVNSAEDEQEARLIHSQLEAATRRFLQRAMPYFGHVSRDEALKDAVLRQCAVVDHAPNAASSRIFRALAARISQLAPSAGPRPVPPRWPVPVATLAGAPS